VVRERGHTEGYAIWAPWLRAGDVQRVLIRKSPDGWAGGWKLGRIRVWFGRALICDRSPNQWLEDERRWWVGCVNDKTIVTSLRIKVTTGDVAWAGTDDDVVLTLAGRNWNLDNPGHDDFERGHTDTFDLDPSSGLRTTDLHSIRIHKSPDGFAGGWRLQGVVGELLKRAREEVSVRGGERLPRADGDNDISDGLSGLRRGLLVLDEHPVGRVLEDTVDAVARQRREIVLGRSPPAFRVLECSDHRERSVAKAAEPLRLSHCRSDLGELVAQAAAVARRRPEGSLLVASPRRESGVRAVVQDATEAEPRQGRKHP
jgi:hypothetical protein